MIENMEQEESNPGGLYVSPSGQATQAFPEQQDQDQPYYGDPSSPEETEHIEDISKENPYYDTHIQVVKPYAIEEPDDEEPAYASGRLAILPAYQDRPDSWQGDLVDSMEGLHCDSDNSDPRLNLTPRRGKKRKPPPLTPSGSVQQIHYQPPKSLFDAQYDGPTLSLKRPRRKSKRSRDNLRATHSPYRNRGFSGSSGSSLPSGTSVANHTNGSTALDAMEID